MRLHPCLALAALALPLPALAQSGYPGPRYADPVVIRDFPLNLRECLGSNDVLLDRRSALEQERDQINAEAAALARTQSALDAEWRSMDRTNASAVADYNARSTGYNQRAASQNARVSAFNARAATLNDDTDYLVQRCTGAR